MTRKIFKIALADPNLKPSTPIEINSSALDSQGVMAKAIEKFAPSKRKSKNLVPIAKEDVVTDKKTSILFLLLPEWAKNFPPYNIARLAALTKLNGYTTYAFDINVKAWREHLNWEIDFDPWHYGRDWKWLPGEYEKDLHPRLEPLFNEYLDKIEKLQPTIVGFTLYYCNRSATEWMAKEIKRRFPNIIIAVGGPECLQINFVPIAEFDYVVAREGEEPLLTILKDTEAGIRPTNQIFFKQDRQSVDTQRLDLDSLPYPDYSHFELDLYEMPSGVNSELSRGCIAKCTFCNETHFWKYRNRSASSALSELYYLNNTQGTNFVYFIDSLVNGNMTELKEFATGLIENNLEVKWMGYARCDKRMNLEFLTLLAKSGCSVLNYGCESGSNKVLKDMDKKNTREEIEQNLRDGAKVGIKAITNWLVAFPTEELQDLYETFETLWRIRDQNLMSLSGGAGFNPNPESIIGWDLASYNISQNQWYGETWVSNDYRSTKIHRLFRVKSFNILTDFLVRYLEITSIMGNRPTTHNFYKIEFSKELVIDQMESEVFDFNIIQIPDGNSFSNQLVNEIWPILRLFWRALQEYKIEIVFDPTLDATEYGSALTGGLTAKINFSINKSGNWEADFDFEYIQDDHAWNYSSPTKPNFSFKHRYINSGQW
jgi:hypothetical protein